MVSVTRITGFQFAGMMVYLSWNIHYFVALHATSSVSFADTMRLETTEGGKSHESIGINLNHLY